METYLYIYPSNFSFVISSTCFHKFHFLSTITQCFFEIKRNLLKDDFLSFLIISSLSPFSVSASLRVCVCVARYIMYIDWQWSYITRELYALLPWQPSFLFSKTSRRSNRAREGTQSAVWSDMFTAAFVSVKWISPFYHSKAKSLEVRKRNRRNTSWNGKEKEDKRTGEEVEVEGCFCRCGSIG